MHYILTPLKAVRFSPLAGSGGHPADRRITMLSLMLVPVHLGWYLGTLVAVPAALAIAGAVKSLFDDDAPPSDASKAPPS